MLQHFSRLLMLCDRQKQHLNMEFFWFTSEPQKVSVPAKQVEMGKLKYCCCEQCAIKNLSFSLTREAFRLVQETVACLLGMLRACCQPLLSMCWSPQTHTVNELQCNSRQVLPKIPPLHISPFSCFSPGPQMYTWGSPAPLQHLEGTPHQPVRKHNAPGQSHLAQAEEISEPLQGSQNKLGLSPYMESLREKIFPKRNGLKR